MEDPGGCFKDLVSGPSLAMQWLRLHASTAGARGSEMGSQWELSTEARQGLANTLRKNRAVGQGWGRKEEFYSWW